MIIRSLSFFLTVCAFILATSPACFASGQSNSTRYDDMILKQLNSDRKFNSEEWKQPTSDRKSMLYDLAHSTHLIGMNGAEVQGLLGEPLWQTGDSVFYSLNDKGRTDVLQIEFKQGLVSRYAVGFHFCRGASCVHLSKWHMESTNQTPSENHANFLDTNLWTQIMNGGMLGLRGGEALLEDCFARPSNTPFVSSEWKKCDSSVRYKMLYDLVHSHQLIGMNRTKIIGLLGSVGSINNAENKLPINQNLPAVDSFDRYPVLLLGRGGCINRPYIVFDIGYHNQVAVGFRIFVEPNRIAIPACWETMGKWQVANLAQGNGGGLSSSSRPSAGN